MVGKPQKGGHHGVTTRGWTPQSNHKRCGHHGMVETTESPQEGGHHRRVETMGVTMGGWKPQRHQTVATELNRNRRKL